MFPLDLLSGPQGETPAGASLDLVYLATQSGNPAPDAVTVWTAENGLEVVRPSANGTHLNSLSFSYGSTRGAVGVGPLGPALVRGAGFSGGDSLAYLSASAGTPGVGVFTIATTYWARSGTLDTVHGGPINIFNAYFGLFAGFSSQYLTIYEDSAITPREVWASLNYQDTGTVGVAVQVRERSDGVRNVVAIFDGQFLTLYVNGFSAYVEVGLGG